MPAVSCAVFIDVRHVPQPAHKVSVQSACESERDWVMKAAQGSIEPMGSGFSRRQRSRMVSWIWGLCSLSSFTL